MKYILTTVSFLICLCGICQDKTPPLPSANQLAWQAKPFYLFMHFGPNTFTGLEWGKGSEKEETFNPGAMDCRQWCRIARAAGATGIVITAKHHDGFCLWPSAWSKHTVAQSPWKNGKGDVLKELSAACREYGLSMGVYLSPWDRNHPDYGTAAYNEVYIKMMQEVVLHYGPFFEFWWDGANGEGPNGKKQVYDWNQFEKTIRMIAPNTMVFSDIGPDIRWVGNETGTAGITNWNLLDTAGYSRGSGAPVNDTLNRGNENGKNWIPAECDVSIRPGWFYRASEDSLVKSPEKLFDIYLKSVGRGANLILNVPPDTNGLISAFDSAALMGFAKLRDAGFSDNLIIRYKGKMKNPDSKNTEIFFGENIRMNCLLLSEDLRFGQRIKSFTVGLYQGERLVYKNEYTTVGSQRIITFPVRDCNRIRIDVTEAKAGPVFSRVQVFRIPEELVEK